MEKMKAIKKMLVEQVYEQMQDLEHVDTQELGEVIDMIKDMSKSIYNCTIVEAMDTCCCDSTADLCGFVKLKMGGSSAAERMQALSNYLTALTKDLAGITADEKRLIQEMVNKM